MVWAKLTPSARSGTRSLDLDLLKDRLQLTKEACDDIDGALNGSRGYTQDVLSGPIGQLIAALEGEREVSENKCELYLLHSETVMLLASKAREIRPRDFCALCQLLTVLGDRDGVGSSVDRRIVLTLTMFQNKMLSYGAMDRTQEESLSQLLYAIAARMRATPRILSEWFEIVGITSASQSEGSAQCQQQFPLLYLLIDFAYRDKAVGEYARTGLLCLVDAISLWPEYEQWILQSNLCTLLASGLGALYSQLNRSVSRDSYLVTAVPPIVAATSSADDVQKETVNENLRSFVNYALFWQDLVKGCRSGRLKQSLLHHFESLFVEQILVPSVFESTDDKGDYSVALISILRCLFETLELNSDLSHFVLCHFLKDARFTTLEVHQKKSDTPSLKEVIIACIDTKWNGKLRVVALQLLSTLCRKYYPYVMGSIFSVIESEHRGPYPEFIVMRQLRVLKAIRRDVECDISGGNEYLHDIELKMVNAPYVTPMKLETLLPVELEHAINGSREEVVEQLAIVDLDADDEIMKRVYKMLQCFFTNSAEVNLALTGLLVDIGTSSWCTLSSWLLDSGEQSQSGSPKVTEILQQLSNQYQQYAETIEGLDEKMGEFQQRLASAEERSGQQRPDTPPPSDYFPEDSPQSGSGIFDEETFISRAIKRSFSANLKMVLVTPERSRARSASTPGYVQYTPEQTPVGVNQICGSIYLLREFVNEIEALVRVRSWLVD